MLTNKEIGLELGMKPVAVSDSQAAGLAKQIFQTKLKIVTQEKFFNILGISPLTIRNR